MAGKRDRSSASDAGGNRRARRAAVQAAGGEGRTGAATAAGTQEPLGGAADGVTLDHPGRLHGLVGWIGLAAAVAAFALAVLMSVRPIDSPDLGYHLAYGEHFLDTGRIVQTNEYIYTELDPKRASKPEEWGPGCWYDAADGKYHFINANWLTQVVMAWAHRHAGVAGLQWLQSGLIAGVFLCIAVMLRSWHGHLAPGPTVPGSDGTARLANGARRTVAPRLPWPLVAATLLLATLAGYERFSLRPEVFGYLVLAGQLCLLVRRDVGWKSAAAAVLLQVLAVNVHSYFLLSIVAAGALAVGELCHFAWQRLVKEQPALAERRRLVLFAATAGGMVLASLANPWFVRGAWMPVETVMYLGQHGIIGKAAEQGRHPWALIGELSAPFSPLMARTAASRAYNVLLAASAVAAVLALVRGRIGWLLIVLAMVGGSLQARRNTAVAALFATPMCALILHDAWPLLCRLWGRLTAGREQVARFAARAATPAAAGAAALLLAASAWLCAGVVDQSFYFNERRDWRFGTGVSAVFLPVWAAEWINRNQPVGRVYSDFDSSSNIYYMTQPHRPVPILTNTWATPPYVMEWYTVVEGLGLDPADSELRRLGVEVVVLHDMPSTRRLLSFLAASPEWATVDVSPQHVVFLHRNGPNKELAEWTAITKAVWSSPQWAAQLAERLAGTDPVKEFAWHNAAMVLTHLGFGAPAIHLWQQAVQSRPDYGECGSMLGAMLLTRGNTMLRTAISLRAQATQAADPAVRAVYDAQSEEAYKRGMKDWEEAERQFLTALQRQPENTDAQKNLKLLATQRADLKERGQINVIVPPK